MSNRLSLYNFEDPHLRVGDLSTGDEATVYLNGNQVVIKVLEANTTGHNVKVLLNGQVMNIDPWQEVAEVMSASSGVSTEHGCISINISGGTFSFN